MSALYLASRLTFWERFVLLKIAFSVTKWTMAQFFFQFCLYPMTSTLEFTSLFLPEAWESKTALTSHSRTREVWMLHTTWQGWQGKKNRGFVFILFSCYSVMPEVPLTYLQNLWFCFCLQASSRTWKQAVEVLSSKQVLRAARKELNGLSSPRCSSLGLLICPQITRWLPLVGGVHHFLENHSHICKQSRKKGVQWQNFCRKCYPTLPQNFTSPAASCCEQKFFCLYPDSQKSKKLHLPKLEHLPACLNDWKPKDKDTCLDSATAGKRRRNSTLYPPVQFCKAKLSLSWWWKMPPSYCWLMETP